MTEILTRNELWRDPMGLTRAARQAKLKPSGYGAHRELRRRVHIRDEFACQACGYTPPHIPERYDGRSGVWKLCVDHIIPWSRGGLTQSDNLRTLCDTCNAIKGNRLDEDVPAFSAPSRFVVYHCEIHGLMQRFGDPAVGICPHCFAYDLMGEMEGPFIVEAIA